MNLIELEVLLAITGVLRKMSAALDRLSASVDSLDASEKTIAARLAELAQAVKDGAGTPADEATLTSLADRLDAITTDMNAAVEASKA